MKKLYLSLGVALFILALGGWFAASRPNSKPVKSSGMIIKVNTKKEPPKATPEAAEAPQSGEEIVAPVDPTPQTKIESSAASEPKAPMPVVHHPQVTITNSGPTN